LTKRFGFGWFYPGSLLYLSTNIATILVALFPAQKFPNIHRFCADYYFLVNPISLVLIGLSIAHDNYYIYIFSIILVIIYFMGFFWQLIKFKINALMEMWAFLTLSVWTLVLTLV